MNRAVVQRLYFTPETVEAALDELGPTGTHAEAIVKSAAMAAVHVMRGGVLEVVTRCDPAKGIHSSPHVGCVLR